MKTRIIFFILMSITVCQIAFSQAKSAKYIDSLRNELKHAKSDTAKIKLRFEISDLTGEGYRISFWDSLVNEAHAHNLHLIECKSLGNLAYLYTVHNDTANYLKTALKSIKKAEDFHFYSDMFGFQAALGVTYVHWLQLKKGLSVCFNGLKLAEELKDKHAILEFNNVIATAYWFAGDFNKALSKRSENLKLYIEIKDSLNICYSLMSIGDAYGMIKDKQKASEYYLKSARFFKESYGSHVAVVFCSALGSGYRLKGQYDSANYYYIRSYELAKQRNSKHMMASTLAQMAVNNYDRGNYKEAKEQALRSLKICNEIHFSAQIPELALTLKNIYVNDKNYKEALKYYDMSISNRDSIANVKNQKLASEKEFDYEFEKKENENKLLVQKNQIQALELKQNNYFMIGMGALLILIVFIGYLFIRQNKLRNEQQSTKLEQKLLLSQMNPHFIFNSLQAIQNFVLKHDERSAVKYLSSFAAVTRNVLENSRMEFIPLNKEIALLENYLQLQKLRFKDRFNYEINVDETIDVESITIPPMLSQPFIENAIEHGFHDIENDGLIIISYALKNNELVMEISDNGTGIKDNFQFKKHRSLALEITKERVVLMNKKAGKKMVFSIGEAFPLQDNRKGVKVSFCFPLTWQV